MKNIFRNLKWEMPYWNLKTTYVNTVVNTEKNTFTFFLPTKRNYDKMKNRPKKCREFTKYSLLDILKSKQARCLTYWNKHMVLRLIR